MRKKAVCDVCVPLRVRLQDPPADGPNIESAHQIAAASGQSAAPSESEDVMLHFVTFVHKDGA